LPITPVSSNNTFALSGTSGFCSDAISITTKKGTVINFTVEVNDTVGDVIYQKSTKVTVANTIPTLNTIVGGGKENEPFNSSLLLYIDMDDWNGTYVKDRTNYSNDGLIVGANRSYGQLGWGMKFDGVDDYMNASDFQPTGSSMTVSAWVNYQDGETSFIVGRDDQGSNRIFEFRINDIPSSNILEFIVTADTARVTTASSSSIPNRVWTHVVGVYDGTDVRIYINGVQDGTPEAQTGNIQSASIDTFIGRRGTGGNPNYFNGTIDEVKIWNIALSADEIAKRYSQGRGTGNITTQTPLAVAVNESKNTNLDADDDVLFTAVDWWKNNELNATTGKPDDNGTVLFMTFDARNTTGTIEDYSIFNNTGTIVGGKFTNDSAMGLGAFEFDGSDDYINISSTSSTDSLTHPLTMEAWIKTEPGLTSALIHKSNGTNENGDIGFWMLILSNGKMEVGLSDGTSVVNNMQTVNTINDNSWHHVVGVITSSNIILYLDGSQDASTTHSVGDVSNGNNTLIGKTALSTLFYNGKIDEVRIYNRSLSASEISQHYWAGVRKGLTLNQSQTRKNENWNATVTLYDSAPSASTAINFSFDTIGNTIPNGTNFVNVSGVNQNENFTLAWTDSFDPDVDDGIDNLRYYLFLDTNNPPTTLVYDGEVSTAEDGLVSLWHFNGSNASTLVDAKGSNDGTSNGGLACGVKGRFGKGCEFNGDSSYINISNLNFSKNKGTLSAWIKVDSYPESTSMILWGGEANGDGFGGAMELHIDLVSNGQVDMFVEGGATDDCLPRGGSVNIGEWNHIVGTYDLSGVSCEIFVNGVSVASDTGDTHDTSLWNSEVLVGAPGSINQRFFNGTIDEVAIYNRSLSAEEIELLYNLTKYKTNLTADGTYFLQVKASDDDGNSSLSPVFNSTLDTVTPFVTLNITNNTFTRFNQTLKITLEDTNPFNLTMRMYKDDNVFHTATNSTVNGRFINITIDLNVTEDGNYTIEVNGSDSHTKKEIKDYKVKKDNSSRLVNFITGTSNVTFKLINATGLENKGDKTPAKIKNLNLNFIRVDSNAFSDRHSIEFNYTKQLQKYTYFEYTINLTSDNKLVPIDSDFIGHFITGDNWIDFEPADDVSTQKINDFNYLVKIGINNTDINLKSIGGLNTIDVYYNLVYDFTKPNITLISPLNNTGDKDGNITFIYNVTDTNGITSCSLIINNQFNLSDNSITGNIAQNITLTNIGIGAYNWSINCSDSSGNIANSSVRNVVIALATKFNGTTTDLTTIDIRNITNLTLENTVAGKINFTQSIDLSQGTDLNRYVNISFNRIEINSTALHALNKSATLYLYNLTFSNPRILRDSSVCSSDICTKISFTKGNLIFSVTNFTVYSSEETPAEEAAAAAAPAAVGAAGSGIVSDFTADKNLLTVDVKQGETKQETLKIKNTGNVALDVEIEQEGLENLLILSEEQFSLDAKETKTIQVNIFASETQKPGVYTGRLRIKAAGKEEVVVVIIEVKEKVALFDIKVEVEIDEIQQGDEVEAEIALFNLGDLKPVDVELYYAIRDLDGNDIVVEHDTIAVEDEKLVKRKLRIPKNLEPGMYMFYVEARYNGKVASSVSVIYVIEKEEIKLPIIDLVKNIAVSTWIFILIIILTITYYNFGTEINQKFGQISRYAQREFKRPHVEKIPREIIPKPRLIKREKRVIAEEELLKREERLRQKERALARRRIKSAEQSEKEKLLKQLKEWKAKGYDTTLLEAELRDRFKLKRKLKSAEQLEKEKLLKQVKEWKAKGYDTTLLEAELKYRSKLNIKKYKPSDTKPEINKLSKKIKEWKSKGYDIALLEKEIEELENKG